MSPTDPTVAAARLRALAPIDKLSQPAFRDLLANTTFRAVPTGARVYKAGDDDDWSFYLLDGSLELEESARRTTLRSGTPTALGPLGADRPRRGTARALSDCMVARVPTSLLDVLVGEPRGNTVSIEVDEIGDDDGGLDDQLQVEIYEAYSRNELEIPSLPDVAVRIRQAVEDPDVTAHDIERIVTADPAIAARLVQVANSPAYGGTVRVESCREAVTRLGFNTTRELVTSVALKQVFKTDSPMLRQRIVDLWQHSTRVAAISYQLAKVRRGFSPDRALLAGLVHDIGALPVLAVAQRHQDLPGGMTALDACIRALRSQVGALVLRQWDFPDDLVTVALEAEEWHRQGARSADYCDLVLVAQLLGFAGTPEFSRYPKASTLPAFSRLTLDELSVDDTLAMLEHAQQEIDELQRLLAG